MTTKATRIKVNGNYFKPYISAKEIQTRTAELALKIDQDFEGKRPLFIAILNGAFMFAADFIRNLTIDCEISFIKYRSYKGMESTGVGRTLIGLDEDITDRHIILLEDIIDTGNTIADLLQYLSNQPIASMTIVSLLVKPESIQHQFKIDHIGFNIPPKFVLGYGLDYDGLARNYPDIYQLDMD